MNTLIFMHEHEYDPQLGNLGRGAILPTTGELPTPKGYSPFELPGSGQRRFPVYGSDGALNGRMYQAFMRERNGKHLCVAYENNPTEEERKMLAALALQQNKAKQGTNVPSEGETEDYPA